MLAQLFSDKTILLLRNVSETEIAEAGKMNLRAATRRRMKTYAGEIP